MPGCPGGPGWRTCPAGFLFAIDDGRGDVAGLGADVVAVVRAGESSVNGARSTAGGQPARGYRR